MWQIQVLLSGTFWNFGGNIFHRSWLNLQIQNSGMWRASWLCRWGEEVQRLSPGASWYLDVEKRRLILHKSERGKCSDGEDKQGEWCVLEIQRRKLLYQGGNDLIFWKLLASRVVRRRNKNGLSAHENKIILLKRNEVQSTLR